MNNITNELCLSAFVNENFSNVEEELRSITGKRGYGFTVRVSGWSCCRKIIISESSIELQLQVHQEFPPCDTCIKRIEQVYNCVKSGGKYSLGIPTLYDGMFWVGFYDFDWLQDPLDFLEELLEAEVTVT
jgi:hypothetical protein